MDRKSRVLAARKIQVLIDDIENEMYGELDDTWTLVKAVANQAAWTRALCAVLRDLLLDEDVVTEERRAGMGRVIDAMVEGDRS